MKKLAMIAQKGGVGKTTLAVNLAVTAEAGGLTTLLLDLAGTVDLAKERSRKNPVYYVQYVHARTSGIFREAPEGAEVSAVPQMPLAPEERELVKRLAEFPGVVREAAERRGPHAIPVYAIRLADDFHRFYDKHKVLEAKGSDHQSFRLALVAATRDIVARSLDLVGVEAPEHM